MKESDATLVARIRLGDNDAADALLRRHFRSSYLVALARVGNPSDAEDVCQDAFIKCLERIHTCRDPESFAPWLMRIVRNTAHNRMEYLGVRSAEPIASHLDLPSVQRSDAAMQRRELRVTLLKALSQLSTAQREVVLLHDLEGRNHADIAAHLEMSVLMSRRHLSDGRKRLRNLLGDYATLEPDHD